MFDVRGATRGAVATSLRVEIQARSEVFTPRGRAIGYEVARIERRAYLQRDQRRNQR